MLMLALIWWMYSGYAWLTNAVSTRGFPGGPCSTAGWAAA